MKIAVIANHEKDKNFKYTGLICDRLTELGAEVMVTPQASEFINNSSIFVHSREEIINKADIVLALGGDGTILHAAKEAALSGVPVLGVNIGHLGFMAGLEVDELEELKRLLNDDFITDDRMMLEITFENRPGVKYYALNDVVISKGALSRIIDISISCNGRPVSGYRADGVIVSTPTGSTAYSLSAGGPIIDPVLECIEVTPICPHSLLSRTVLFTPQTVIGLQVKKLVDKDAYLTIDGHDSVKLEEYEKVNISKANQKAKLIRLKDISFYEVLNNKFTERGV
ncbi:ATP-NAD/AcoX kinase [[Clostridium] cellulosi]|uniref:NAD kinase n=1 Tax=[Clostridium] cellulosi TaxID=29343 RepID=A0A078KSM2_9FIRM|nr:ATP-NAD/AcoX kinase [[Clostridium] cellulosi]